MRTERFREYLRITVLALVLCLSAFLMVTGCKTVQADTTSAKVWFAYADGKMQEPDEKQAIILHPTDVGQFKTDALVKEISWKCEERFLVIGTGYDDHKWINPETGAFQPCEYVPTRGGVEAELQDKDGNVLGRFIIRIVDEDEVIRAALRTSIHTAEGCEEEAYTAYSFIRMQNILEAAKNVYADTKATQAEVDRITDALNSSLDQLVTKAENVMAQIRALPAVNKLTLKDKQAVEAVRKVFEALTDEQKTAVENRADLENAEKQLQKLEAAANAPKKDEVSSKTDTKPSVPSKPAAAKPAKTAFTIHAAVETYNQIKISWNRQADISGYRICRSDSAKGKYKAIATVSANSLFYRNKKVKTGQTYYYKVYALHKKGAQTICTNTIGVRAVPGKSAITKITGKNKKVSLKWKKVSGASGYQIYRADSLQGKYRCIKTQKGTSLTNKKLKKGKQYYYRIRAYRKVGKSKIFGADSAVSMVTVK